LLVNSITTFFPISDCLMTNLFDFKLLILLLFIIISLHLYYLHTFVLCLYVCECTFICFVIIVSMCITLVHIVLY